LLNLHLVLTSPSPRRCAGRSLPRTPPPERSLPGPAAKSSRPSMPRSSRGSSRPFPAPWWSFPPRSPSRPGMRRGEILALHWSDIDEDLKTAHVRRTLQMTNDGLVYEQPKTKRSRRVVALPAFLLTQRRRDRSNRRTDAGDDARVTQPTIQWAGSKMLGCRNSVKRSVSMRLKSSAR
jgi:hypothetical protein